MNGIELRHDRDDVRGFHAEFTGDVIVGLEASGYITWFMELLEGLGHQVWLGDAAEVRRRARRRQKNDRQDSGLILDLLRKGEFPRIHHPLERKLFGGTCVNTGCTPTKTLVASAYAAHLARRSADFGVLLKGPVRVDMKRVKARADAVVGDSRGGVEQYLRGMAGCTVVEGHARFEGPDRVRVGEELLTAPRTCSTASTGA